MPRLTPGIQAAPSLIIMPCRPGCTGRARAWQNWERSVCFWASP